MPSCSQSHREDWVPRSQPRGATIPKERSPSESKPPGQCKRNISSVLFWVGHYPHPVFCFLSLWSWANFEQGSLKPCLDSWTLSSLRPLKAWEETFKAWLRPAVLHPSQATRTILLHDWVWWLWLQASYHGQQRWLKWLEGMRWSGCYPYNHASLGSIPPSKCFLFRHLSAVFQNYKITSKEREGMF